jgi:hypothetical protein
MHILSSQNKGAPLHSRQIKKRRGESCERRGGWRMRGRGRKKSLAKGADASVQAGAEVQVVVALG